MANNGKKKNEQYKKTFISKFFLDKCTHELSVHVKAFCLNPMALNMSEPARVEEDNHCKDSPVSLAL